VSADALTASWPLAVRLGLFVGIVTATTTWIAMPCLVRVFADWLYAPPRS
jgi:antibiotic biosynthesis monooxygenase (ABM) superfamily enzyme